MAHADFEITSSLTSDQRECYVDLLTTVWWHADSTREQIERAIDAPQFILAFVDGAGHLLACSRCITDYVFKALVLDVVVAPEARGGGLGTKLLKALLEHEELKQVMDFELYCTDELRGWYQRLGFDVPNNGVTFVRHRRMH